MPNSTRRGLAVTINMLAFLPMMGMGQAISILVGQRLGEEKPEIAETFDLDRPLLGHSHDGDRGRGLCDVA